MECPLLPPVGNGGPVANARLGFFSCSEERLMDIRDIEAEEAASIVGLWLKIIAYLIAFAALGTIGFLAVRWIFFS